MALARGGLSMLPNRIHPYTRRPSEAMLPMPEPDVKPKKTRLDVALAERGLAESRSRAQALVMARRVRVNGEIVDKSGFTVQPDDVLSIDELEHPFVGRGGMKLAAALSHWHIDLDSSICLDIGASTGGFTDCMLQAGAATVYAIDVGYGQLDQKLRNDARVVVREKVNARYLDPADFPQEIHFVSIDVSFISLSMILPAARLVAPQASVVALIKPQFEVGRADLGKGGIVREESKRLDAVERVSEAAHELGLKIEGVIESPVRGAEGNIEYLMYATPVPR